METDEMKCPYCSNLIKKSTNFCPKCGHKVSFDSKTDNIYTIYKEKYEEEQEESRKDKSGFGAVGVILLILGPIIFYFASMSLGVVVFVTGIYLLVQAFSE